MQNIIEHEHRQAQGHGQEQHDPTPSTPSKTRPATSSPKCSPASAPKSKKTKIDEDDEEPEHQPQDEERPLRRVTEKTKKQSLSTRFEKSHEEERPDHLAPSDQPGQDYLNAMSKIDDLRLMMGIVASKHHENLQTCPYA